MLFLLFQQTEPETEAAPASTEAPAASTATIVPVVVPRDVTPSDQEDDASVSSTLRREMGARRVKAPPGKLGIVIDSSEDGPVVKSVKANSPLEGLVFPDDLIVAVGSTETKGMTGAELTTHGWLLVAQTRVLTVVSRDLSDKDVSTTTMPTATVPTPVTGATRSIEEPRLLKRSSTRTATRCHRGCCFRSSST